MTENKYTKIPISFISSGDICKCVVDFRLSALLDDSGTFSIDAARASAGLALASMRFEINGKTQAHRIDDFFTRAGFSDVDAIGYDEETSDDSLSSAIASVKIGDVALIACTCAGENYGDEWINNLIIGSGDRHEGFNNAAMKLKERLINYIASHHVQGNIRVWLAGFSRSAAICNILAAEMSDLGYDICSYGFGVPRTVKREAKGAYKNIFNIIFKCDPVSYFPLNDWGYSHYGQDVYLPDIHFDSNYMTLKNAADAKCEELSGHAVSFSPMDSDKIRRFPEYGLRFYERAEYYEQHFLRVLLFLWEKFADMNPAAAFLHTIDSLRKEKKESKEIPMFMEHSILTYVSWILSDNDPAEMLTMEKKQYIRLVIDGRVRLKIYRNGKPVAHISSGGTVFKHNGKEKNIPATGRLGDCHIISLPMDENYTVSILPVKGSDFSVYSRTYLCQKIKALRDRVYMLSGRHKKCMINFNEKTGVPVFLDENKQRLHFRIHHYGIMPKYPFRIEEGHNVKISREAKIALRNSRVVLSRSSYAVLKVFTGFLDRRPRVKEAAVIPKKRNNKLLSGTIRLALRAGRKIPLSPKSFIDLYYRRKNQVKSLTTPIMGELLFANMWVHIITKFDEKSRDASSVPMPGSNPGI